MAITSGFFNSVNGDRRYSADDFGAMFKGVIIDGIFKSVMGGMRIRHKPGSINRVVVSSGRAFFSGRWVEIDSDYTIDLGAPEVSRQRIDLIAIRINKQRRETEVIRVSGPSSTSTPAPPLNFLNDASSDYLVIGWVNRHPGVTMIQTAHITNCAESSSAQRMKTQNTVTNARFIGSWAVAPTDLVSEFDFGDYDKTDNLKASDSIMVDKGDKTYRIEARDLAYQIMNHIPEAHNLLYRGKYLGNTFTAAQQEVIANGSFEDLWIGDYWIMNGVTYRIAHFDYFYGYGKFTQNVQTHERHHAVIVPDTSLDHTIWTSGGAVHVGGYQIQASRMVGNAQLTIMNAGWSGKTLRYSSIRVSKIQNGRPIDVERSYGVVDLMSENMVFGVNALSSGAYSSAHVTNYQLGPGQFALFRLSPHHIIEKTGVRYWLRDIGSNRFIVGVDPFGTETLLPNDDAAGIRPFFVVG